MPIDVSTKQTGDGIEVVLHSERQREIFESHSAQPHSRIIRQYRNGSIYLHTFTFWQHSQEWQGCGIIIGPRGKLTIIRGNVEKRSDGLHFTPSSSAILNYYERL